MKILITGGCGFVGSNIAVFLKNKLKKAKIYSLDNLFRKGSEINLKRINKHGIKNFKFDIRDFKKIKKLEKFSLMIVVQSLRLRRQKKTWIEYFKLI